MQKIKIQDFFIGPQEPLCIISGPCVMENLDHLLYCAESLSKIFTSFPFCHFIFKASFDKANRSSVHSFRGPGLEKGLQWLEKIKNQFNLPILTDIHTPTQATAAADVCDMIQIPAFLCRQTDLLLAAGNTHKPVNIKKGQFLSPYDMKQVVEKLCSTGNENILLTERGASFGYHNLVSDMRSIPIMQQWGFPVCFDATHSVQLPGQLGATTGGERQFSSLLAKTAVTAGCQALFIESHPSPSEAKSDASSVMDYQELQKLLKDLEQLYPLIQKLKNA